MHDSGLTRVQVSNFTAQINTFAACDRCNAGLCGLFQLPNNCKLCFSSPIWILFKVPWLI